MEVKLEEIQQYKKVTNLCLMYTTENKNKFRSFIGQKYNQKGVIELTKDEEKELIKKIPHLKEGDILEIDIKKI